MGQRETPGSASRIADFLKKQEGPLFLNLHVSPAEVTAAFLRARGFEIDGPHSYQGKAKSETPNEFYWTIELKGSLAEFVGEKQPIGLSCEESSPGSAQQRVWIFHLSAFTSKRQVTIHNI